MPDNNLRRRALESGKTTSNKAKSKQSSRESSRVNSTPGSRVVSQAHSRDVSSDEGDEDVDADMSSSINSTDALLDAGDYAEQGIETFQGRLTMIIEQFLESKNSITKLNKEDRKEMVTQYCRILTAHYIPDPLTDKVPELLHAFGRIVRAESSEQEIALALRAVALTCVTIEDDSLWETVVPLLKRTITDSASHVVQVAAIHCLGMCASFGGAGEEAILEVLVFLLEIVSSDGTFGSGEDRGAVVRAALQDYSFLATQVEDLEGESEEAIETFLNHLNLSSDHHVQIAAGEAIALLYEKSFTPLEDDEEPEEEEEEETGADSDSSADPGDTTLVKRYDAYHNKFPILERVTALANLSTKHLRKRDKRDLHRSFTSIAMTVENPRVGLRLNNASKMTVKIHQTGEMKVDQWWKLMRLASMRRLLAGGFVNHYYEGNPQVLNALPMILREMGPDGKPPKHVSKAKKGRHRESRPVREWSDD